MKNPLESPYQLNPLFIGLNPAKKNTYNSQTKKK